MDKLPVWERIHNLYGRRIYLPGLGFGTVVKVHHLWGNLAKLTIQKRDGTLVCSLRATII